MRKLYENILLWERIKYLVQGNWWAFFHAHEIGFHHLTFNGKPILLDDENLTTTYQVSYATYSVNGSSIKCGWCHKDVSRLGVTRLNKHLTKHEQEDNLVIAKNN